MGPGSHVEKWLLREKRKNIQNHLLFSQHVCIHFETTPWKTWAFTLRLSNRWTTHRRWEFPSAAQVGGGGKVIGKRLWEHQVQLVQLRIEIRHFWKSGGMKDFCWKMIVEMEGWSIYMFVSQIGRGFGGLSWVILVIYSLILVGWWFTTLGTP